MKIVINRCFGGFGLSQEGLERYKELSGVTDVTINSVYMDIRRDDKFLVKTIEDLGVKASGRYSVLEVIEIPDDVKWEIREYDGAETIEELHRSWP